MVSEIKNNDNKRRKLTVKTMTRAMQLVRHVLHIFFIIKVLFYVEEIYFCSRLHNAIIAIMYHIAIHFSFPQRIRIY